jgi:hypothetical protein
VIGAVALAELLANVPKSNFTQRDRDKRVRFKCLSKEHNIFKCPKVAQGGAQLLFDRAKDIWKEVKSL